MFVITSFKIALDVRSSLKTSSSPCTLLKLESEPAFCGGFFDRPLKFFSLSPYLSLWRRANSINTSFVIFLRWKFDPHQLYFLRICMNHVLNPLFKSGKNNILHSELQQFWRGQINQLLMIGWIKGKILRLLAVNACLVASSLLKNGYDRWRIHPSSVVDPLWILGLLCKGCCRNLNIDSISSNFHFSPSHGTAWKIRLQCLAVCPP